MIIDHIGVVARSLDKGIALWTESFGYRQKTEAVVNTRQKVKVVFLEKEGSLDVKLLEPVDETSPVYKFALKGGGLHHLCFKCDSLDSRLEELSGFGFRVLAGPEPGEAFENENIAFVYATQGLNIELIDTDKRAGTIDCQPSLCE
jgi:methylmalonyl-CoA/ethylmalonyl-CoA epimerase